MPTKDKKNNEHQFLKEETEKWKRPGPLDGDLVGVALKVAEERHQIELKIKEALLAGDDEQLKHFARRLVGLSNGHSERTDAKPIIVINNQAIARRVKK
jgi:hypothetical protein